MRFLNLSQDEIKDDYEDLYSYYKEGNTNKYILHVLKSLEICQDKTKTYCDYACGEWNTVVPTLKSQGYNIIGYDKFVGNQFKFTLNNIDGMKFDILFNNNFIEHVIDPIKDIEEMISKINIGGYLILITGCFEYRIEFTHYHTFFFSDKSLEIIGKKLGFIPIITQKYEFPDKIRTTAKVFKKI